MTDAVILAGGTIPDREADFREAVGVNCKSLIPLHGRIMVAWVIEALKGAEKINRVAVVGPPELQEHPDCAAADLVLEEAAGRSENLFLALEAFPDAQRILMVTSDMPLATPDMYDDLLDHFPSEVDIGYVLVPIQAVLDSYADRPPPPPDEKGRQMPNWVTLALRDGKFTGTACLLIKPQAARESQAFIKGIFDDREMGNVIRTLRPVFGLPFLIRAGLVFKYPSLGWLLSIGDIERKLSSSLGVLSRCHVSPHAELAFDVDHVTDVPIAEGVLKQR